MTAKRAALPCYADRSDGWPGWLEGGIGPARWAGPATPAPRGSVAATNERALTARKQESMEALFTRRRGGSCAIAVGAAAGFPPVICLGLRRPRVRPGLRSDQAMR